MTPTRSAIAERGRLTAGDHDRLVRCRHDHTRLGLAYQIVFYRLTGRLPQQEPFEVVSELVHHVAGQLALARGASSGEADTQADALVGRYADRPRTVYQHHVELREYLGVRPFTEAERDELREHLRAAASHLERPAGLVARAEAYLRGEDVLLPAPSTLRRLVGEVRAEALNIVEGRIAESLPDDTRRALDALLLVDDEVTGATSALQAIKEPPGAASPRALVAETDKLDAVRSTGVLGVDLSWLRPSLRKALARRVRYASAHRLREAPPSRRYAALVCFLQEAHADSLDHVIDLHAKLVTKTYRKAERALDEDARRGRRALRGTVRTLRDVSALLVEHAATEGRTLADLWETVLDRVPEDTLRRQIGDADEWLAGAGADAFERVTGRFSYLRQFSPSLVESLAFEVDPAGGSAHAQALVASVDVLRTMNETGRRRVPPGAPTSFIPKRRRRFVERGGEIDRAAYEAAVLTAIRDELRRGNVAVQGSKRFGHLSDLFMPEAAWEVERDAFFERSGLPARGDEAATHLRERLDRAYGAFVPALPGNDHVTIKDEGTWRFSKDPATPLGSVQPDGTPAEDRLAALHSWLEARMRRTSLPDLLIEVDNALGFTRHLAHPQTGGRSAQDVCEAVAAVIAYGCNLGPQTMATLTDGVSYSQIKRVADTHLHEDALRQALAVVVDAISRLDTARVWGEGRTSSSDGQRFLFPRRTIKRSYNHRMGGYALEFYSFIADNYAPFYSAPIECTERDAAYVLDGLLYHESDLEIDEHYTDTHGYSEIQFAAFAALGKRFCPRIRGLHKQRIYRASDDPSLYGPLWPMLEPRDRRIRLDWIEEEWDRIGRFFCSMATGHTTASVAMKRAVAYGGGNHFYRALRETGRVFKTEFVLDYLGRPALRRRVRRGLLKSEELHALARSVFYGKLGRADWRDFRRQASTASCLTLILACVVYWQAREIERAVAMAGDDAPDFGLLAHVSPIQWENVTLYGSYDIRRDLVETGGRIAR